MVQQQLMARGQGPDGLLYIGTLALVDSLFPRALG